ncbi:MAG: efflux RND transporter permease subunit [Bacteroidetes bacterium]|nr:efflux RND transporter permease subunit [Bacteroidota bacterium]
MKKLIEYFVKHPIFGNSILALIMVFGLFALINTKVTFFPDQPAKFITITASYLGASPEEIEEGITIKIEDAIKGITGVDRTTSTSSENFASISVELKDGADANVVLQDVQSAVNSISSFPAGLDKLNIYKQEPREFVISIAVNGELSLRELKTYGRRIERDLLAKQGISKIKLSGFPEEEIEVSFREDDLRAYNLRFDEVANSISGANVKITGGKIKGLREEFLIRADNKKYYAEELKNHVIKTTADGTVLRLKDVADVIEKWAEDPNRSFYNGHQSIIVQLQKTNDEDLFYITNTVKEYMAEFNDKHDDVQLDVVRDGSTVIRDRMNILEFNGMIGAILILLLLGLSLNPRLSFWVALSIPVSFLGMFVLGQMYGLTLNVMSLLAMILVIGILVDDGIVVGENIYTHYERGESPIKAAVNGTIEVLPSVFTGVSTTIVIFLIFFFLQGALGDRARDLAFVVATTLVISLIETLLILPAHIAHSKALQKKNGKKNGILQKVEMFIFKFRDRVYKPILNFSIKHPLVIIAIPIALFIITIGAVKGSIIKTTFFPNLEFNNVTVTLEMPAGTSDLVTDSILVNIENAAWAVNDDYVQLFPIAKQLVVNVIRSIGPGTHQGSLRVTLSGSEERFYDNFKVRQELRNKIGIIKNANKLQIGGGSFFGMPVSIALQSNDLNQLRNAKDELKSELNKIIQLKDVADNDPPGLREVQIQLNDNAYNLGLNTATVMSQVRGGFFGNEAQRILRGIDEVRIWVRYSENERRTIKQLEDMRIRLSGGQEIPLSELANISVKRGILSINHIDGQRIIKVEADISNPDVSVPDIVANIKKNILPELKQQYPDVTWIFEGESRESAKTMGSVATFGPPFLMLMFMLVVLTFRSFMQAAIIYLIVPFSIIGVLWGHFIQGYIFSILSGFGAIALIGIVVNDSLIFVSAMNRYLLQGQKFEEAIRNAGINRFRPVMLTTLTTVAGLGPLIFEPSVQAQFLSPMAISVAYGLIVGTGLTLTLLPAMLVVANKIKMRVYPLLGKEVFSSEDVEPVMIEQKNISKYE